MELRQATTGVVGSDLVVVRVLDPDKPCVVHDPEDVDGSKEGVLILDLSNASDREH